MAKWDFSSLIQARIILNSLWQNALLKGRCWGPKTEDNPFAASNITIAIGTELISVSQKINGVLVIHEFSKTTETSLGLKAKELLEQSGLVVEDISTVS